MIVPIIHQMLRRDDLARLVAEIAVSDPRSAKDAAKRLEAGQIDALLDLPISLKAVRGRAGVPGALPLPLLWYVPIRALLRDQGVEDITIADFTATIPVSFVSSRSARRFGLGDPAITSWAASIGSLPHGTIVRAERAAYCAALALWWAGCFPERVESHGGRGMLRAYVDFAAGAFEQASQVLDGLEPATAKVYQEAAQKATVIYATLDRARRDYLGNRVHTPRERIRRFLKRMGPGQ